MTNIQEMMEQQLDDAREGLAGAEEIYAQATLKRLEAAAALDEAKKVCQALEAAMGIMTGRGNVTTTPPNPTEPASPIVVATEIPQSPSLTGAPDSLIPVEAPSTDESNPEVRRRREEARAEALAIAQAAPKCIACGRQGYLQRMQHPSGVIITQCNKCGNQSVG